jgi:hypothetical protein
MIIRDIVWYYLAQILKIEATEPCIFAMFWNDMVLTYA